MKVRIADNDEKYKLNSIDVKVEMTSASVEKFQKLLFLGLLGLVSS